MILFLNSFIWKFLLQLLLTVTLNDPIKGYKVSNCDSLLGTYSDTFNTKKCKSCPTGTYNEETGQSSCTKCPPGTWGDYPGAFASFWCKPCPSGTYNSKYGQNTEDACIKCPRGTYASNTGSVRSVHFFTVSYKPVSNKKVYTFFYSQLDFSS